MANFKDMQLTEVDDSEYSMLKQKLGLEVKFYRRNFSGVAKITKPWIFKSFEELLEMFRQMPTARRASAKISPKNWMRLTPYEINPDTASEICKIAENGRLMFLSFFGGENNEIGFEPLEAERGVVSTSICIPGELRHVYDWIGSDNEYYAIWGLYEPIDIKKYCSMRGGAKPANYSKIRREDKARRVLDLLRGISPQ